LIRNACQSYFDPGFNLSKSLCSGTSRLLAMGSFDAGTHVVVEKPATSTFAEL
jgi:hypothetical protein